MTTPEKHGRAVAEPETQHIAPVQLRGWRLYTVLACLCLGLTMSSMDSSIVGTALVVIGRDFDDFLRLQWVVLSYLLTFLGFALVSSRISDVVGRKWVAVYAMAILTAGSLGAGLAQNLDQLIAFRAIQGLGASGVYSIPMTAIVEITPLKQLPFMGIAMGLTLTCSSVLGPILGGVITTQSTWRWVFLYNVPLGIILMLVMLVAWPRSPVVGKISWTQLDVVGCLLSVASSTLFVFALQQGGAGVYAWSSPTIVSALVVAALTAVALGLWIRYLSSGTRRFAPLFPARIITDRVMGATFVISTLTGYLSYTVIIELPERLQVVNGTSSQKAGVALLALLCSSATAPFMCGILTKGKRNLTFHTVLIALCLTTIGLGLLSSIPQGRAVPTSLYGYEVIFGFGLGSSLVTTILIIKLNANENDTASAQGLMCETRVLGGNIGLAIATVILNSHLAKDLKDILSPQQIDSLRRSLTTVASLTPPQAAAVAVSLAKAFKTQMQVATGVSAAGALVALLLWQRHPPTLDEQEREKEAAARIGAQQTAEVV